MSLFEELKRRNVFRVGIAYVVGGWLLLQFTEVLSELLKLPDVVGPVVVAIVLIGFPIVLFAAWAFELTPEGVKRESEVDRTTSITPQTGKKLNAAIMVMLAVGLAYFIWESRFSNRALPAGSAPGVELATEPDTVETSPPAVAQETATPAVLRQSIAVLPFDNRSRLEDDEFFVEGIHDDLLTNLARISSLKVISRTSVGKYKDTEKTIPEIAGELGVATIMEGAVQRSGNTVRINVQLIDAQTDEHLWAEIFDRELTADNLFAIQSEISGEIARALEATLSPEEAAMISERPTENLAAYTAYQRGRNLIASRKSADLDMAAEEFQRAVELDPEFALGWVAIAEVSSLQNSYSTLDFVTSVERQQAAVDRALALDDELGEAWLSLALLKTVIDQPAEAESAFQRAIKLAPGYATAYHWYAMNVARTPRRRAEAAQLLQKALELDPLSSVIRTRLGATYQDMGQYDQAENQLRQVLELDPGFASAYVTLSNLKERQGKFAEAVMLKKEAAALDPGNPNTIAAQVWPYLHMGDTSRIAALRRQVEDLDPQNVNLGWIDMVSAMYVDQYPAALEHIEWVFQRLGGDPQTYLFRGYVQNMMREYASARASFELAAPEYFDPAQAQLAIEQDGVDGCFAAWLMMQTGDEAQGRQLLDMTMRYAVEDLPKFVRNPDTYGTEFCLVIDEPEAAMDLIERRVSNNNVGGWFFWRKHPQFEPLWGTPRFEATMQKLQVKLASERERLTRLEAAAGP